MCYVIDLVWFSLRIITNYEYCEDEFLPVNAILESASEDNQNLNSARSLGMLIRDVWEGKVKKVSKSDNGAGYLNLRKRSFNELHKNNDIIRELTDKTVEDIRLLCADRPNWVIDSSLLAKKSIVLMHPLNPDRSEAVAIDGHRLTTYSLFLKTYYSNSKEVNAFKLCILTNFEVVFLVIRFIS